jgi:TonB family protein
MPKNWRFWRNVLLIGAAHVVIIAGLVRWSRESKNANAQNIVWMNGGAGDGAGAPAKKLPPPKTKISTPPPATEPEVKNEPEEDRPVLTSVRSDIKLPAGTPTPSPRSISTPKPSATPKTKVTPKPTAKPKPKPTPKPSPKKMVVAKASPKPKPTPEETKEKDEQKDDVDLEKKKLAKEALEKNADDSSPKPPKAVAAQAGSGKGTSAGNGGHAGGSGGQSQFGWYGSMLHDRFYSEWVQPTSLASSGEKNSVLVKIRIEKDGRVSNFEIIKPSGDASIDESVSAVAKRVTQVDPLPAGLGNGENYDVKINFELNSDQ